MRTYIAIGQSVFLYFVFFFPFFSLLSLFSNFFFLFSFLSFYLFSFHGPLCFYSNVFSCCHPGRMPCSHFGSLSSTTGLTSIRDPSNSSSVYSLLQVTSLGTRHFAVIIIIIIIIINLYFRCVLVRTHRKKNCFNLFKKNSAQSTDLDAVVILFMHATLLNL